MEESENLEEEVLKRLEKMHIKEYCLFMSRMLRVLGEFAKGFGEVQKSSELFYITQKMQKPTLKVATLVGTKLIGELEAEKIGPLLKAMSKVPPLDFSKPLETTAEEKIQIGETYISLAEKIEEILK